MPIAWNIPDSRTLRWVEPSRGALVPNPARQWTGDSWINDNLVWDANAAPVFNPAAMGFGNLPASDIGFVSIALPDGTVQTYTDIIATTRQADHDTATTYYRRNLDGTLTELGTKFAYQVGGWVDWRNTAVPIVLALAGGVIASGIGAAVIGPQLASTYPGLASAIGQTAIQIAQSGGNIEAVMRAQFASLVGANIGGLAGGAIDSPLAAKVVSAATSAVIVGADPSQAAQNALLFAGVKAIPGLVETGVKTMDDFFSYADPVDTTQQQYAFGGDITTGFSDPISGASVDLNSSLDSSSGGGVGFNMPSFDYAFTDAQASIGYHDPVYSDPADEGLSPVNTNVYTDTPNLPPLNPSEQASNSNWVVDLTNLALAAIKVNAAYQQTQGPAPRTVTQGAGGVTTTGNSNGTVTVRNPSTGQVSVTRPGVGIPYVLANGSTIINNGDGTFSTIKPDGSTIRSAYGATASSAGASMFAGIPPALLWGGAGIAAFMLLRK